MLCEGGREWRDCVELEDESRQVRLADRDEHTDCDGNDSVGILDFMKKKAHEGPTISF